MYGYPYQRTITTLINTNINQTTRKANNCDSLNKKTIKTGRTFSLTFRTMPHFVWTEELCGIVCSWTKDYTFTGKITNFARNSHS